MAVTTVDLGMVRGEKGATGATGATGAAGAAAGFGTPTATVDANVGTPSVTVTASGANTSKVFNFAFRNLKGATGAGVAAGGAAGAILRKKTTANYDAAWEDLAATTKELGYMKGATSSVQAQINGKASKLDCYPVGALYISFVSTSPASLFGGTWAQITGRFLRAANDVSTGGADAHTLTEAQMPSHHHGVVREQDGDWAGYWQSNASSGGLWQVVSNGTQGANRGLRTTAVGGGTSHNNMPAYQDVYVWRRTA